MGEKHACSLMSQPAQVKAPRRKEEEQSTLLSTQRWGDEQTQRGAVDRGKTVQIQSAMAGKESLDFREACFCVAEKVCQYAGYVHCAYRILHTHLCVVMFFANIIS